MIILLNNTHNNYIETFIKLYEKFKVILYLYQTILSTIEKRLNFKLKNNGHPYFLIAYSFKRFQDRVFLLLEDSFIN